MKKTIGFIGAGQMSTALAGGFLRNLLKPDQLFACDVSEDAGKKFAQKTGARILGSIVEVVSVSDLVFLAVKPQHVGNVFPELRKSLGSAQPKKTLISIAAGISIRTLTEHVGENQPVIRVMPNTPCLIGKGVCGLTPSSDVCEEEVATVEQLLQTVGSTVRVQESQMDVVTGLSGSGPAFVYMMIEALSDAGVLKGLPRSVALQLAVETVRGASEMVLQSGEHPAVLKDRVTSPGGTTIAGIRVLEEKGLRSTLIEAVASATERSAELGKGGS
ncbi:MAG: pyrroline-5-carboxylate reductase [Thermoguttaceae bacterium]